MNSKTILITGVTGFLGSHLVRMLLKNNYKLIGIKRATSSFYRISDIAENITWYTTEKTDLLNIFQNHKIDTILHCATDYGRKTTNPLSTLEANLILPLELLDIASNAGVKTFINTDTILDKRINNYTLSKKHFYEWLRTYSSRILCINIALEHFYGPYDDQSKFITFIIKSLLNNEKEIKLTLGEQKRDFIYIDDVVEAFLALMVKTDRYKKGLHHFEIGSGTVISIADIVRMTKELCGNTKTKLKFGALPYRKNEVMESKVNLKPLLSLGWSPKTSLKNGLKKTIEIERSIL